VKILIPFPRLRIFLNFVTKIISQQNVCQPPGVNPLRRNPCYGDVVLTSKNSVLSERCDTNQRESPMPLSPYAHHVPRRRTYGQVNLEQYPRIKCQQNATRGFYETCLVLFCEITNTCNYWSAAFKHFDFPEGQNILSCSAIFCELVSWMA